MDEEGVEAFQFLQMKHQSEMQDLKLKDLLEHRKLESEENENSGAIGKEYEYILEKETYHQSRSEYCLYCFEHTIFCLISDVLYISLQ